MWIATNLDLDSALVKEAVAAGGRRTKKEAVTEALKEYDQACRRALMSAADDSPT